MHDNCSSLPTLIAIHLLALLLIYFDITLGTSSIVMVEVFDPSLDALSHLSD